VATMDELADQKEGSSDHTSQIFQDGATLFQEGEAGDYAYYIEEGKIELISSFSGKDLLLATLGPGDMVGEMALLDNQARTATACVRGRTQVIRIHPSHLLDKLRHTDPLIALILKAVLHRFRDMRERLHLVADQNRLHTIKHSDDSQVPATYDAESKLAGENIKSVVRLNAAFDNQELEAFAQPIVSMVDRRMVGAEVLLRWRHPVDGLLGPENIISLAEHTGLIVNIGYGLIEQSCAALKTIDQVCADRQFINSMQFISINVSPRQLQEADFVERVREIIQKSGVDPRRIKLEITESMMLEQPQLTESRLQLLKSLGVRIALDDFGTGYSSLSSLMDYSIDTLKIDRSFVIRMGQEHKVLNIVKAILTLADALEFDVIAEGVEYDSQANLLISLGCTAAQGYLFARPMPLCKLAASGGQLAELN
jgi:diguanylate cyclase